VASLINQGVVDASFLEKVGVMKEIETFRENLTSAKGRCPEHLDNVWAWWPNLKKP
jgi:hypothetical protein